MVRSPPRSFVFTSWAPHNYRDSFESESPSGDEQDGDDGEASPEQSRVSSSKSAKSTTMNERHERSQNNPPESAAEEGNSVRKTVWKRQMNRSHGSEDHSASVGSGSQSAGSNTRKKKDSKSKIRIGDKVVVYLPSGGKEKGTILVETSRDRYEVALENGTVEKRVHPRNIALTSRHRDNRRRSSSSRTKQQRKEMSTRRHRNSRDSPVNRQQSVDTTERKSDPSRSSGVLGSPYSSSAEAQPSECTAGEERPVVQSSPEPSTALPAASGEGDPAQQPPDVGDQSPGISPKGESSVPTEALASESDPDTSNGERGSSSERGSSTLSSKARQAQGLLKTVRPSLG